MNLLLGVLFIILIFFGFRTTDDSGWTEYPEPTIVVVEEASTAVADPQTLTITINLSAKPEDIEATAEGEPCAGAGRFDDLTADTRIAIYDAEENLLAVGTQTESTLTRAGTIFSDCTMVYVIEDIPTLTDYIFEIPGRSVMTLSFDELEAEAWSLNLNFGP